MEKLDNRSQETVTQQAEVRPGKGYCLFFSGPIFVFTSCGLDKDFVSSLDSAELTQRFSEGHVEAEGQQQKVSN